jgi:hypothetical protein
MVFIRRMEKENKKKKEDEVFSRRQCLPRLPEILARLTSFNLTPTQSHGIASSAEYINMLLVLSS